MITPKPKPVKAVVNTGPKPILAPKPATTTLAPTTRRSSLTRPTSPTTKPPSPVAKAPTKADFDEYFAQPNIRAWGSKLVYWSGTQEKGAIDFASAHGRKTLDMLIKPMAKEWAPYMTYGPNAHYKTWEEVGAGFWGPVSSACAGIATGEVWFYAPEDKLLAQKNPKTPTFWVQSEKGLLLAKKADGIVTNIVAYQHPEGTMVREINSMTD